MLVVPARELRFIALAGLLVLAARGPAPQSPRVDENVIAMAPKTMPRAVTGQHLEKARQ